MTIAKLTIIPENDDTDGIVVQFNPNEIELIIPGGKIDTNGQLVVKQDYTTLNLNLFFDTTLKSYPPENVQKYTKKIVSLTQPRIIGENEKRPPRCKLIWGNISSQGNVLLADCFLERVTQKLTHFLEDGTPVRATLDCSFKEWKKQKKNENPIDDPVRIVKRGETLSIIASEEYGDPFLWRVIADENNLINPRKLPPGTVLTIPPLKIANII